MKLILLTISISNILSLIAGFFLGSIWIGKGQDKADLDKDGQFDITQSSKTFKELLKLLPDTFEVEIR